MTHNNDTKTPAGGHAPNSGVAGTATDGQAREVAAAPPAGRTIEATTGIRPDCPTCTWPNRETVNMVCPTCGFDYGNQTRVLPSTGCDEFPHGADDCGHPENHWPTESVEEQPR